MRETGENSTSLYFFYSSVLHLRRGTCVKNVSGTGDKKPPGRSVTWKQHYLKNGGQQWPHYCCIIGCMERADGAGHVHIEGQSRGAVYIVPMCDKRHNTAQNNEWLLVKQDTLALRVESEDENSWCVSA